MASVSCRSRTLVAAGAPGIKSLPCRNLESATCPSILINFVVRSRLVKPMSLGDVDICALPCCYLGSCQHRRLSWALNGWLEEATEQFSCCPGAWATSPSYLVR